jgi:ECF sigma factor
MRAEFIDFGHLLNFLNDESLRQVALCKMKKLTTEESAVQLGWPRRLVARKLRILQQKWENIIP